MSTAIPSTPSKTMGGITKLQRYKPKKERNKRGGVNEIACIVIFLGVFLFVHITCY